MVSFLLMTATQDGQTRNNIVRYQSPIILVPGIDSMEGNFPPDSGGLVVVWGWFKCTFIDFKWSGCRVQAVTWMMRSGYKSWWGFTHCLPTLPAVQPGYWPCCAKLVLVCGLGVTGPAVELVLACGLLQEIMEQPHASKTKGRYP